MAIQLRAGNNATVSAATVAVVLPAGTTTGDIAFIALRIGAINQTVSQTGGTGTWTIWAQGNNSTGGYTYAFAYRVLAVGDTAPTFSWPVSNSATYSILSLYSDTGVVVFPEVWAAELDTTTAGNTVTPNAATAGGDGRASVIMTVAREATVATAPVSYTYTPPTGWVTSNSEQWTGTTNSRFSAVAYQLELSGTVTPGAETLTDNQSGGYFFSTAHALVQETAAEFLPHRSDRRSPRMRFRRYQPHQRAALPVEQAALSAVVGDVAATVVESDTVTAVAGAVGAVTATVTAGSTVTAVVAEFGATTATVTAGSTVSGVAGAVGSISATVTSGSTVTGAVGKVAAVTATVTAADTVTGATGGGSPTGAVTATVTAGSTVTAVVGAVGAVTATVTAGSTVTAVVGRVGAVSVTVTAGSTVTGAVAATGAITATVTAGSTVTGVVGAVAAVTATVTAGSTVTGSTVAGRIGTITATVTTGSTVSGVVGKFGDVAATVTAGSAVTPAAAVTATVTAGSTVVGVVGRSAAVTATVTAGSTLAGLSSGNYVRPGNLTAVDRPTAGLTVQQLTTGGITITARPVPAITPTT